MIHFYVGFLLEKDMKKVFPALFLTLASTFSIAQSSDSDKLQTVKAIYEGYLAAVFEKNMDFESVGVDPRWGDLWAYSTDDLKRLIDNAKEHDSKIAHPETYPNDLCMDPLWGIYGEWQDLQPTKPVFTVKGNTVISTFYQFQQDPSSKKSVKFVLDCKSGECLVKDFINEHGVSLKNSLSKKNCSVGSQKTSNEDNTVNHDIMPDASRVVFQIYKPSLDAFNSRNSGGHPIMDLNIYIWGDLYKYANDDLKKLIDKAIEHDGKILEATDPSLPVQSDLMCYLNSTLWSLYGPGQVADPSIPKFTQDQNLKVTASFLYSKNNTSTKLKMHYSMSCEGTVCKVKDLLDSNGNSYSNYIKECINKKGPSIGP